jgi:membrane protease YdiL (CAAX protease family)
VSHAASIVGLAIALGGVALLASPAHRLLGAPDRLATRVLDQVAMWALLAGVLAVVVLWEQRPLASLGLQPLGWGSVSWGLALAAVQMWAVFPATAALVRALGLAGFESGIAAVASWPLWLRLLAVVTAGVVEEALFRGYAIDRLAPFTGGEWTAAALSLAAFALVHLPMWGPGPVVSIVFTGGVATAFFVWRGDLLANVIAHLVTDAMGLIVVPYLSRSRSG